jgi:putative phage-type endonuclease
MNARTEWLLARRAGIGGSDIGAIMGLSPWRSPLDVYLDKTATEPPEEVQNDAMYWGTVLEEVVAREYATRTGRKVQRVTTMLRHPKHEWMLGNIDRAIVAEGSRARLDAFGRLAGAEGILECKTASAYKAEEWSGPDGSDAMPVYYAAQCMWYLAIAGLDWCDVAVLIGGQQYHLRRVERDEATIRGMIEQAEAFWRRHVLAGVPPEPRTGAEAAKLFARDNGDLREICGDGDLLETYNALRAARAGLADAELDVDQLADKVKLAIGPAAGLALDGKPIVTWKAAKDTQATDWKAVAAALNAPPEIVAAHTITKPGSRRFIVNK